MKLTSLVPLFLCTSLATSKSLSFFGGDQSALNVDDNDLSVPGENPLVFCRDTSDDILAIDYVDLTPNPPEACVFPSPPSRIRSADIPCLSVCETMNTDIYGL